ncbi:hypothetical protein DL991_27075 [Amycolatopsis sp. WAC 01375]|nr:hypothetical protein DL991_27075 [Amycolatopsis sp. WAC 01375]
MLWSFVLTTIVLVISLTVLLRHGVETRQRKLEEPGSWARRSCPRSAVHSAWSPADRLWRRRSWPTWVNGAFMVVGVMNAPFPTSRVW